MELGMKLKVWVEIGDLMRSWYQENLIAAGNRLLLLGIGRIEYVDWVGLGLWVA